LSNELAIASYNFGMKILELNELATAEVKWRGENFGMKMIYTW
jgi:hypothetical protein